MSDEESLFDGPFHIFGDGDLIIPEDRPIEEIQRDIRLDDGGDIPVYSDDENEDGVIERRDSPTLEEMQNRYRVDGFVQPPRSEPDEEEPLEPIPEYSEDEDVVEPEKRSREDTDDVPEVTKRQSTWDEIQPGFRPDLNMWDDPDMRDDEDFSGIIGDYDERNGMYSYDYQERERSEEEPLTFTMNPEEPEPTRETDIGRIDTYSENDESEREERPTQHVNTSNAYVFFNLNELLQYYPQFALRIIKFHYFIMNMQIAPFEKNIIYRNENELIDDIKRTVEQYGFTTYSYDSDVFFFDSVYNVTCILQLYPYAKYISPRSAEQHTLPDTIERLLEMNSHTTIICKSFKEMKNDAVQELVDNNQRNILIKDVADIRFGEQQTQYVIACTSRKGGVQMRSRSRNIEHDVPTLNATDNVVIMPTGNTEIGEVFNHIKKITNKTVSILDDTGSLTTIDDANDIDQIATRGCLVQIPGKIDEYISPLNSEVYARYINPQHSLEWEHTQQQMIDQAKWLKNQVAPYLREKYLNKSIPIVIMKGVNIPIPLLELFIATLATAYGDTICIIVYGMERSDLPGGGRRIRGSGVVNTSRDNNATSLIEYRQLYPENATGSWSESNSGKTTMHFYNMLPHLQEIGYDPNRLDIEEIQAFAPQPRAERNPRR